MLSRMAKGFPYNPSQSHGGDGSTCTWHARQEVEANWPSKLRIWHATNSFAENSCFARIFFSLSSWTMDHQPMPTRPLTKLAWIKEEFATGFVRLSAIWASLCTHRVMVWPRSSLWNTLTMSKILYFSFKQQPCLDPFGSRQKET